MDLSESLSLAYQWAEGSLPPPGHYEYHIEIRQHAGTITFLPDYPQNDLPVWFESFVCTDESLFRLYEVIESTRLFTKRWKSRDLRRIGGSTQSLEITLNGKTAHIPYELAAHEQDLLQPVFDAVKELVPRPVWESLYTKREIYIQEHTT